MLWLNEAFMCCLANTLSVISSASNNKNKSLFTEQLGWGRVKGEKRPASKMFSSAVDGIQSPVLQTCGRATYQFSLIFVHIFFTPKTVKTEQHRIALSFCTLIRPLFLTSEIPIFPRPPPPFFVLCLSYSVWSFCFRVCWGAGAWKQVSLSFSPR